MAEQNQQNKNPIQLVGSSKDLAKALSGEQFKEMVKAVAGKYMSEERIIKVALLARTRSSGLANCSLPSFLQSAIKAAELGLDFAGQTGQAYLVPLKNKWTGQIEANFWPGYQGFIELTYRSGKVDFIDTQLVHEKDKCEYQLGSAPYIHHRPCVSGDAGPVLFGYAIAFLKEAKFPKIEIMSNAQLEVIRGRSRAKDNGPWKTDEEEMKRKTLIRRIWKYLPKTPEMIDAEQADNQNFEMTGDFVDDTAQDAELGVKGLRKRIDSKDVVNTPPPPVNNKRRRRTKAQIEQDLMREKANVEGYYLAELNNARNLAQQAAKELTQEAEPVINAGSKYHCELCKKDVPANEVEIMENDQTKEKGLYHNACGYAVEEVK